LYGVEPTSRAADTDDIIVVHDFAPAEIDNNIGCYVANELLPLLAASRASKPPDGYAYAEQEVFERYVGSIVRSMDGNERRAWHLFYDNTLTALQGIGLNQDSASSRESGAKQDFITDFGAIYRRVASLTAELPHTTVLDVATCFGFLPLFLASRCNSEVQGPSSVVGCDLNPALVTLAGDYARQRQLTNVSFVRADILAGDIDGELAPLWPVFDIVTAIHLLEHLEPEQTRRAVNNLWRVTRRRLIVAVPFETVPDPRFGHRQVFDREMLVALGQQTCGDCRYFEHHGGWIVLDRASDHIFKREGSHEL
jgi:ubiquinone/menaquinone biosynthesis C-methylase UbiE